VVYGGRDAQHRTLSGGLQTSVVPWEAVDQKVWSKDVE
jgi:hypothetical protein